MGVTTADVTTFIRRYADVVAENRKYLIDLDRPIGDSDHGENMNRGFKAAAEKLDDTAAGSPADVLKAVAMALVAKVGGAAGPLYGTAFLKASGAVSGKHELSDEDVVAALEAALDGVVMRGKAEPGDKTMVDAWRPAVDAARAAVDAGEGLDAALTAAAAAADKGKTDTIPLVARKGRASYLGERSKGHQDPGATSSWLLFDTLASCR